MQQKKGMTGDLAADIALLPVLTGADFWRQLVKIAAHRAFHETEPGIFGTGGTESHDYEARMVVARKAVQHGFTVFLLPNPKTVRSADFIFVKKGYYALYDLKTISGKSSVGNRLRESVGQTDRVLLHLVAQYNVDRLAQEIKRYFEINPDAMEVLIFRRNKMISVNRLHIGQRQYYKNFRRQYIK